MESTLENKNLVSIIIPCYNEEGNISKLFDQLLALSAQNSYNFEIIAVNDGSKDGTWEVLKNYANAHTEIRAINLMGNHGLTQAYTAGFDASHGTYVITVAADLEIPTENINKVVEHLENGYDFVNTNRTGRWDSAGRKLPSRIANALIGKISGVYMKDTGSGMKGFRRVLIDNFKMYGEMHRMIPAYLSAYGAKMIEFDVPFKDREYGQSAYGGLNRTIKVMLDLITLYFMLYFAKKPFKAMPGRLFGATGALISGVGGVGAFYLLVLKLMGQSIGNRPLFFVSIFMLVIGLQSMMIGMIGELLMRTYFESGSRKTYTVREIIG
ncbi:glycosyltransferase family 2 protein [Patescibacteria group bacterium]|nr:glycosyltransferase family 2 protein [Patescibacteria group bacterium]